MSGFGSSPGFQDSQMNQLVSSFGASRPSAPSSPSFGSGFSLGNFGNFLFGVASSGLNYLFSRRQQKEQNEYNEEQIDKMNNYNSFNAVKNRLIAAGVPEKAAINAIAGSPSLGQQSSPAVATPYVGNAPGTDFMQGMSSSFANQLVDSQAQNVRAATANDKVRLQTEVAQSSLNMQKTLSEILNIDSKTLAQDLERQIRFQNIPFEQKFLEYQYIIANIRTTAWDLLTPSQKKQVVKNYGNAMYNDASYAAQRSKGKADNAHYENQVEKKEFAARFDQADFTIKEVGYKIKNLGLLSRALAEKARYEAKLYGWSSQKVDHEVQNANAFFEVMDQNLVTMKNKLTLEDKHTNYWLNNEGLDAARTTLGFGSSALDACLDIYKAFK